MLEMNHIEVANILETVYGRKKGEDIPIVQASLKAADDERKIASGEYAPENKCANCGIDLGPVYCPKCYKAVHGEPENKPLTLEQLRQMDGEPAYIVAWPDWGHWELSTDAEDYFEDRDEDFYGMTMPPNLPDPHGKYGLHMMGWLAYARKPEQEGNHE